MHVYLHLFGLTIPSYGLLIASGVVIGNIIAFFVLKHEKLDFNDWMILEAYCILGDFLGAKLLYLLVSYKSIDWSRITDFQYFNALMLSGFCILWRIDLWIDLRISGRKNSQDPGRDICSKIYISYTIYA